MTFHSGNFSCLFCYNHVSGITSCSSFRTGSTNRSIRFNRWNGLTLHVSTHERTGGIIMFQKWNKGCSNRNDLFGRNVHEINFFLTNDFWFSIFASAHKFLNEITVFIQRNGCRNRHRTLFFKSIDKFNLIGHT